MRAIGMFLSVMLLIVLAGCSGGGTPTFNLDTDPVIGPPVGTQATSPLATKFGPIANYLPPSGTIINYKFSSLFGTDTSTARLQFVSYDNTAGTWVLDIQTTAQDSGPSHSRFTFWIKKINGQSYCYKRKKIFYDEVRPAEITNLTPGALMGLFSANPAQLTCNLTETGHSTGSHSYTEKYLGTATIVAGGTTYANCVISETSQFMPGDVAKLQFYWAPSKGPIMASLSPAIIAKTRLPWWCTLARVQATSVSQ